MPFTPSHAVVALAVVRTPLLPSAVAIGAMTPDLPLFLRGTGVTYQATHTNLLLSSVLAAALLAVWLLVLRPAVRALVPSAFAKRLPAEWDLGGLAALGAARDSVTIGRHRVWRSVFPISLALSLALGVLTHIVWDAFTHEGRWGLALLPALAEQWGPLHGYRWLQYASSVLGLLGIAAYGGWWLRRRPATSVPEVLPGAVRILWWASLPAALIIAVLWGLAAYGPLTPEWTVRHLAYRVLPPACAVWAVVTLCLCVAVQVRRSTQAR